MRHLMADPLTNRQLVAITHILASPTHEEACRRVKISKGTLYTWLKDDAFKMELKRQRDEVAKEACSRLKCAMTKAVEGLIKLMDTPRPDLKRWIYKDIIEYAFKTIELENIEERLDRIEQSMEEPTK